MKYRQMRPYLKDLQQNRFEASNQTSYERSNRSNLNVNDDTTEQFYQQRRKRAASIKHHTLLKKNVSYLQKLQIQCDRASNDLVQDTIQPTRTSRCMSSSQTKQNIAISDKKGRQSKFTVFDALSPNLNTRQRFYSIQKDESCQNNDKQVKAQYQEYESVPCFGGSIANSNIVTPKVDHKINEYMKQYVQKYQKLSNLGRFNLQENNLNKKELQFKAIKKTPSFDPLTLGDQLSQIDKKKLQNNLFTPFGQSQRLYESMRRKDNNLQLNKKPAHSVQGQEVRQDNKYTKQLNYETLKKLQQMQFKLAEAEKKVKFQDKFIDSIQKMRKTIQKTEEQCNLKDLWQWLKKLPKQNKKQNDKLR